MRIFLENTYICCMKAKLNLTIEQDILERIKAYAASKQISISELVEHYFKSVVRPTGKKNIITLVDRLKPPTDIDNKADLKELYYKEQGHKYGF